MAHYRIMQRTRLEDTRIWLDCRLEESVEENTAKRIAAISPDLNADSLDMATAAIIDGRAGKIETYQELIDLLATETEATFTFEGFLSKVEVLSTTVYQRPTQAKGTRSDNLYVQIGRGNAYEWFRSHLRDRIEMTVPGNVYLRFDRMPRKRDWKTVGNKFALCASRPRPSLVVSN